MTGLPSVSVVIPSYNQAAFLDEAVRSATQGSWAGDVEVVVVDDASTDGSRDVLAGLGASVRPIFFDRNRGGGAALNAGIAAARGEVVCLLDADDRFAPDKLARVASAYDGQPSAGWVFHRRRMVGVDGDALDQPEDDIGVPFDGLWDTPPAAGAGRLPYLPTSTSCLTARREVLARVTPLPEHPGALNDNFVKVMLCLDAPGVFLRGRLSDVRLHDANSYSGLARTWSQEAAMHLPTAADLVARDPRSGRAAEGMVAGVVGRPDADWLHDARARADLRRYLSAADVGSRRRIGTLAARVQLKRSAVRLTGAFSRR